MQPRRISVTLTAGVMGMSHAEDWVVLDQRMNFILNLFRSRHHDPRLYAAPFDPSVLAQIQTGTVPAEPSR